MVLDFRAGSFFFGRFREIAGRAVSQTLLRAALWGRIEKPQPVTNLVTLKSLSLGLLRVTFFSQTSGKTR